MLCAVPLAGSLPLELRVVFEPYGSSELCTDIERPCDARALLTRLEFGDKLPGSTLAGSAYRFHF